jgi:hypothetical protein
MINDLQHAALTPAPFPAFGRKTREDRNEGARLAPSCSPSRGDEAGEGSLVSEMVDDHFPRGSA